MKNYLLTLTLVFSLSNAFAQLDKTCSFEAVRKGDILIVDRNCSDNYGLNQNETSQVRLGPQGRVKMAAALRKGLEWASINESRNLSFKKLISEFPAKAYQSFSSGMPLGGDYTGVAVIFNGMAGGKYKIEVVGDRADNSMYNFGKPKPKTKPPFDIDGTGREILAFESASEVQNFIRILEKQPENLDQIFK